MRQFLIIVLCGISYSALAQTSIRGIFKNHPGAGMSFYYYDDAVTGTVPLRDTVTNIREVIEFQFDQSVEKPLRVSYNLTTNSNNPRWEDFYLWTKPGRNDFVIESDTVLLFEGGSEHENNLLKELNIHRTVSMGKYTGEKYLNFCAQVDNSLTKKLSILQERSAHHRFSSVFITYVKAQLMYAAYRAKMDALIASSATSQEINSFLASVDLLSDSAYSSLAYRNGLRQYFDLLTSRSVRPNTSYLLSYFRQLDQKLINHTITKEFLKTYVLRTYGFANENNPDTLRAAVASILNANPQSRYKEFLFKKLDAKITLLNSTQSLPDIALKDTTGQTINLKDFSGKHVFIDFWGTWCAPCMKELPVSQQLHSEFGNEVVFIYINSPVEPVSRWKESIKKFGIVGVHVKLSQADEKKLKEFYSFEGYPFYAIHDKSGKPIHVEGGIRPSLNARSILKKLVQ